MKQTKTSGLVTFLFWGMFLVYLYFLFSIILFKGQPPVEVISHPRVGLRMVNWQPFYFLNDLTDINVIGNLLLFFPLGMYLVVILKQRWTAVLLMFILSVGFEATQFSLNIGSLDVDDVILNVAGGLVGMVVMLFISLFLKNRGRMKTFMAISSTLVGVPIIVIKVLLDVANR